MKTKFLANLVTLLALLATLLCHPTVSSAQSSSINSFTYQGRLNDANGPANGIYDLRFAIFTTATGAGGWPPLVSPETVVSNGLFTVTLDFGVGPFNGSDRWLQIGVRTNGSSDPYTDLAPRQPFTAMPYAMRAAIASTVPAGSITSSLIAEGSKDAELQLLKQTVAELKAAFDQLDGAALAKPVTR